MRRPHQAQSSAGEVLVRVTKGIETERSVGVRIEVNDTGIGISSKARPLIFQAFTQGDGSTTRKHGGTGLGLAIVRGVAEAHGGRVTVESREGKGSRFTVLLPRT